MNRLSKIVVFLLLLPIIAAPLMACAVQAHNAEEQACCREMGGQCGGSDEMPSSHSCCKTLPAPVQLAAAKSPFSLDYHALTFALPEQNASQSVSSIAFASFADLPHSPPGTPPAFGVLRI